MNGSPFDATDLRRKAERALRDRDLPSKVKLDPIRLLHELQVHQVELELQNDELVSANRDLDALRTKYQALYDAAPVGYLTLSAARHVVDCNETALQMLARDYNAVLKRPLRDCFEAASRVAFDALLDQAAKEGSATSEELLLCRPKRIPIFVRAQTRMIPLPHDDGKLFLFVMMDISTLKFALDDVSASLMQKLGG